MDDAPLIAARLALYGDLGLLFGIAFFTLYARPGLSWPGLSRLCALLAIIGLPLSLLGFALIIAQMGGTGLHEIDPGLAWALTSQTAIGWAVIVRLIALLLALMAALALARRPTSAPWLALWSAAALATLAWAGHGAAGEGGLGMIRLGADIVHLIAGSAWLGALFMLIPLVSPRGGVTGERIDAAHAALRGFRAIGTILVALITATGLANIAFIIGPDQLLAAPATLYGRVLLVKLGLFAAMLGCAALNRFRLTPRLATVHSAAGAVKALAALRRTIALETLLALLVLAAVAWLGTLEPPG